MTEQEIKNMIKTKIKEHGTEINGCDVEVKKIQKKIALIQKGETKNTSTMFIETQKIAILKDKALFHNGCSSALKDILEELCTD